MAKQMAYDTRKPPSDEPTKTNPFDFGDNDTRNDATTPARESPADQANGDPDDEVVHPKMPQP